MPNNKNDALEQLCKLLNLSEEAISVAEGWSILPPRLQAHFTLLMNDYLASQHPLIAQMYANASRQDQIRANRIIEAWQARNRGSSSGADS